ncbi:MAG: DUF6261 family protein [Puniceicoccales bacterium]|jgi:hypothetical protein|nr:DUF6261 family protein [Puniceicoccales bacterium]
MKNDITVNEIKTITLAHLRNEEHFGFHTKIMQLIGENALSETFRSIATIYGRRYNALHDCLEMIRKSVYTAQLLAADNKRCKTFCGLRTVVEGCLLHFDPARQMAAIRVDNILRHYRAVVKKTRNEKTALLINLLQELRDTSTDDLQALGLMEWVDVLEADNQSYERIERLRISERAKLLAKNVQAARRALDIAYHALVKELDVHGVLNPEDRIFSALVNELNARIESVIWPIAQRRGMSARQKLMESLSDCASNEEAVSAG